MVIVALVDVMNPPIGQGSAQRRGRYTASMALNAFIHATLQRHSPTEPWERVTKKNRSVKILLIKNTVCQTYASPVADAPGCRNGALPEVAGLDVGWLRAGAADRVLVAIFVVVLAGVNLAARHQALPVALSAGDGALRARGSICQRL